MPLLKPWQPPKEPQPTPTEGRTVGTADLTALRIPRETGDSSRKNTKSSRLKWFTVIGLVGLGLVSWIFSNYLARPLTVSTARVTVLSAGSAVSGVSATGYVVAQRQASVASKATGRLEYLGVIVGDRVKEGQVIARLQRTDVDAALRQAHAKLELAHASLNSAKPELRDAKLQHERLQRLLPLGFVTQADVDIATARVHRAEAAVSSAEAAIKSAIAEQQAAEINVENTNIRAPFDGTVLKKFTEVGEVVAPLSASTVSRAAIVLLADMQSLMVEAEVSESVIGRIHSGQAADIALDAVPNRRYRGEVFQVVPTADRSKATVLSKVRFLEIDDRVFPEASAKVIFSDDSSSVISNTDSLAVPMQAIVSRDGHQVVWRVTDDVLSVVPVETGPTVDNMVLIRGKLTMNETVVLNPPAGLTSGSRVKIASAP